MNIFKLASGCKMHRTAASQKCKFLPLGRQNASAACPLCPQGQPTKNKTLRHALGDCPANGGLIKRLLSTILLYQPGATANTIFNMNLELETSLEFPVVWAIGTMLQSISNQREIGWVTIPKTKADMEYSCRLQGQCKIRGLENSPTQCNLIVNYILLGL